jgi:hypothetical protein
VAARPFRARRPADKKRVDIKRGGTIIPASAIVSQANPALTNPLKAHDPPRAQVGWQTS